MKLSILIPVYNAADYLPRTLDQVLAQTFEDFEAILIDNGSTDGSGDICDAYAQKDKRVKVFHRENTGVSDARNLGVEMAQGEYIGFTDADDLIETDMYEAMLKLAQAHDADVVQCCHDRLDVCNAAERGQAVSIINGETFVCEMFTKSGGEYTNQVSLCTKIFRKELFDGIRFPSGQVYEDEQQTYKLCLKAKILVKTQDILYHYIKRENSIITGVTSQKMLDKQKALEDRLHWLPQQLPQLRKECAAAFLEYSRDLLCRLYQNGEKKPLKQGISILRRNRRAIKCAMRKTDGLYIMLLVICPGWVLKNHFAPLQKFFGLID